MPIVLGAGLRRHLFSSSAAAQKGVTKHIENNGSSLDLGSFSVQLTRLDNKDPLDLTVVKESRRTKSSLCAISWKTFGKESALTSLVLNKPVELPVGSINADQRAVENPLVEEKNKILTYKIYEEVSFCKRIESDNLSPTVGDAGEES